MGSRARDVGSGAIGRDLLCTGKFLEPQPVFSALGAGRQDLVSLYESGMTAGDHSQAGRWLQLEPVLPR